MGLALIGIIQDEVYELLIVVGIIGVFGLGFYFLLPNVVEVTVNEDTINIRKESTSVSESIGNISELTQTFSFLNQSFNTWVFYRLTLKQSNELGEKFYFLTRKSSLVGTDSKEAIGKLNYRIAIERQKEYAS